MAWNLVGPIKGKPGVSVQGDPGEDGQDAPVIPGTQGLPGTNGLNGLPGISIPGTDGEDGDDGVSIVGLRGLTGLTGLPGMFVPGTDGEDGDPGPSIPGTQGLQGIPGLPGFFMPGTDGEDGDLGPSIPGSQGLQGLQGLAGLFVPGADGEDGDLGPSIPGSQGPQGLQGAPGLFMMPNDGEDGDPGIPIQGAQGIQGIPGPFVVGTDGEEGEPAIPIQGIQGIQGIPGPAGIAMPGIDGEEGDQGFTVVGLRGLQGVQGPAGIFMPGQDGEDGEQGPPATNQFNTGLDITWTGLHSFKRDGIGDNAFTNPAITLKNTIASTAGVTNQDPPSIMLSGHVWGSPLAAQDNTFDWSLAAFAQSPGIPQTQLEINYRLNGGAWITVLSCDSDGTSNVTNATVAVNAKVTFNIFCNSAFAFAQRQVPTTLTTLANDAYGPDRWRISRQTANLQYQQIDTNGATETGLSARFYGTFKQITSAGKFAICQPIEGKITYSLINNQVVFQILMKASSAKTIRFGVLELSSLGTMDPTGAFTLVPTWGANSTDPTFATNMSLVTVNQSLANGTIVGSAISCSVTTAWQLFAIAFAPDTQVKNILPIIWTDSQFAANDTLSVAEAGLYYGGSLRDWVEGDPSEEYLRIARYYEKSYDLAVAPGTGSVAGFNYSPMTAAVANNARYGATQFRALKRIVPTVTVYSYTSGTVGAASNSGGTDQAAGSGGTQFVNASNFGSIQSTGGTLTLATGWIWHWTAEAEIFV